jgi:CRISPR/Cas system endoribonuclease Cas6 (RAMP superfamily)
MLLVEIEKPENETLAAWFSDLRSWLDVNRCEPLVFTQADRRHDRLIYRISFENAAQAQQFSEKFARYAPTIRRANSYEQTELRTMDTSAVTAAS